MFCAGVSIFAHGHGGEIDATQFGVAKIDGARDAIAAVGGVSAALAISAGVVLSAKASTAQAGMGEFYELFAIAMAVIGGISLAGGRGSIIGTVLGAIVLGVIRSGFTFVKLDGSYQLMAMGSIIIAAVILDRYRQRSLA